MALEFRRYRRPMKMALVVLLPALMAACGPWSLEACIDDATHRPTDTGVRMARIECNKRFPRPNAFDETQPGWFEQLVEFVRGFKDGVKEEPRQ